MSGSVAGHETVAAALEAFIRRERLLDGAASPARPAARPNVAD